MNESLSRQTIQVIAQRVAAYRKRQRLSLDQLAARAGVSKGSLAGLEKGTGNPGIALLCQTASALGVSVSDLLGLAAAPLFAGTVETQAASRSASAAYRRRPNLREKRLSAHFERRDAGA